MKTVIKLTVTMENSEGFSASQSCEAEHFQDIPSNQLEAAVKSTIKGFQDMMTAMRAQAAKAKKPHEAQVFGVPARTGGALR